MTRPWKIAYAFMLIVLCIAVARAVVAACPCLKDKDCTCKAGKCDCGKDCKCKDCKGAARDERIRVLPPPRFLPPREESVPKEPLVQCRVRMANVIQVVADKDDPAWSFVRLSDGSVVHGKVAPDELYIPGPWVIWATFRIKPERFLPPPQ